MLRSPPEGHRLLQRRFGLRPFASFEQDLRAVVARERRANRIANFQGEFPTLVVIRHGFFPTASPLRYDSQSYQEPLLPGQGTYLLKDFKRLLEIALGPFLAKLGE